MQQECRSSRCYPSLRFFTDKTQLRPLPGSRRRSASPPRSPAGVIVDLSNVDLLASAGISVLVAARRGDRERPTGRPPAAPSPCSASRSGCTAVCKMPLTTSAPRVRKSARGRLATPNSGRTVARAPLVLILVPPTPSGSARVSRWHDPGVAGPPVEHDERPVRRSPTDIQLAVTADSSTGYATTRIRPRAGQPHQERHTRPRS
jgi:hypothetical protein